MPKLTEAFSDTHPKVKSSAEHALEELTKVIKNPEISSISAILLKALTDPATGTVKALEALIETEFLHAIDAPSLALIVPVLHRGLRDRAATTKRYGALISGNICTMINDARDFVPYLPTLLPDLKSTLLDPIPDVRSISAKALGSLTRVRPIFGLYMCFSSLNHMHLLTSPFSHLCYRHTNLSEYPFC